MNTRPLHPHLLAENNGLVQCMRETGAVEADLPTLDGTGMHLKKGERFVSGADADTGNPPVYAIETIVGGLTLARCVTPGDEWYTRLGRPEPEVQLCRVDEDSYRIFGSGTVYRYIQAMEQADGS
jgi:hypothetical protein